ncbi:hypothetical protein [Sphingobacterium sp. T2]|uniref:hypothetical protein n=1 Tax=Sphingobacterium sp. T2 TaxID=1590596 RepID=UPI0012E05111|nr:hypothetical protein [Sphingobacterium sp. T2]
MNQLKKISIFVLITSLLTSSLFISCTNGDEISTNENKLDLSKKVLKFDEMKLISQRIISYQKEISTKRIDSRTARRRNASIIRTTCK